MDELVWIKRKRIGSNACDVSVSINNSTSHKRPSTAFCFRNNCHLQFTKNGLLTLAISGNRIYFKQEVQGLGYKLSDRNGARKACEFKIAMPLYDFVGDYDLMFDKDMQLSYIERKVKESEDK